MESIELTPTDRQLLLYDIFKGSRQVELADITSRLPIGRKMIQRDMKTLRDAGLLEASYSAKEKAYIVKRVEPRSLPESAAGHKGRKYLHLSKLNRIARLMNELYTDRSSNYWDDGDAYYSCKDCYYELFPNANERMRQRDFAQLNRIGYFVHYDNFFRRYKMWENTNLREDFGVYLENGKLMRNMDWRYNCF
ncbi:hypothetical protein GN277_06930 [Lachnospiraceae bacterium WCA-9-b2]|uniref:Uncharacterized protein n=1 Tax=Sporofaciens musculi TaxID=2681861 RepID=A0A7X3MEW9_9FIRM|nr:hypothetical protein [Sporofaciens musculi]MXP75123.1 hypothetical protein [Sporofaciens musculi]